MKDLVDSLARSHGDEGLALDFVVTIAPTVGPALAAEADWRDGFSGRIRWPRDTIGCADVATVVETQSKEDRIIGVEVEL